MSDEHIYKGPVAAFIFDMRVPEGITFRHHIVGDDDAEITEAGPTGNEPEGKRWGFRHFLLWLADRAKGFRVLVVSPQPYGLLEFAFPATFKPTKGRTMTIEKGKATYGGTWRGHDVYVSLTLDNEGGFLAERADKPPLAMFQMTDSRGG